MSNQSNQDYYTRPSPRKGLEREIEKKRWSKRSSKGKKKPQDQLTTLKETISASRLNINAVKKVYVNKSLKNIGQIGYLNWNKKGYYA